MIFKPLLAVVTAAASIAAGAFALSVVDLLGPAEDEALQLVPPDAAIYTNVFLDPSTSQKLALDDLLAHFPAAGDRAGARDRIVELIDQGLAEVGLTFEADIDPWLGDQIAFFMQVPASFDAEPGVALLLETEDVSAALSAVDKAQVADPSLVFEGRIYQGIRYEVSQNGDAVGAVDSFLVSGTETGLKAAIDASRGRSLAEAERFDQAIAALTPDRLALAYVDPAAFARLAAGFPGAPPFGSRAGAASEAFDPLTQGAAAFVFYARGDALVIEGSSRLPQDPALAAVIRGAARESKMLGRLPGDSWLAFGVPELGNSIRSLLTAFESAFAQQGGAFPGLPPGGLLGGFEAALGLNLERDLLAWMGDAAFFVRATNPNRVGGGVVIEATDQESSWYAINRLKKAAHRFDLPVRRSKWANLGAGFALQAPDMPEPFNVFASSDRAFAIYGDMSTGLAFGSDPSLAGMPTFDAARGSLGDGYALGGFVDLSAVFELAERSGLVTGAYRHDLRPWYQPLSFVSFGTKLEGDNALQRVVLGVR
ncbi:MAG TPA: DUF3352 domain-containing protein [Actinomycetota bacterium]|nr:DUF3352 domain-containing protein [Actinomycetota bacterium]